MASRVSHTTRFSTSLVSLAVAAVITISLFLVMYAMVYRETPDIIDEPLKKIADIYLGARDITTVYEEEVPDRPDEPEPPPPDQPPPPLNEIELANTPVNMNFNTQHQVDIEVVGLSSEGEYLPIVKVAPIYPRRAQMRGIEGYCIVGYTVTETGATRSPYIVDCPNPIFKNSSLKAASKFKYKPRVVSGKPIEVNNVQNRFTFELE